MYQNILLPIDLTEDSSWASALPRAIELCKAFDAKLHVLNVIPGIETMIAPYLPPDSATRIRDDATAALESFVARNVPSDIASDSMVVQADTIYQVICEAATRLNIDLIVMAAHRPALSDFLLGPNAARVVRHSTCSVLVVRN